MSSKSIYDLAIQAVQKNRPKITSTDRRAVREFLDEISKSSDSRLHHFEASLGRAVASGDLDATLVASKLYELPKVLKAFARGTPIVGPLRKAVVAYITRWKNLDEAESNMYKLHVGLADDPEFEAALKRPGGFGEGF